MAVLPECVKRPPLTNDGRSLSDQLSSLGWLQFNRGKVRDTYWRSDDLGCLLVVATDRLSIFDFVLPTLVPQKGVILTALTHFWLTRVLTDVEHHLTDLLVDSALPRERCLLVRKVAMEPFEMIFRHHIGGSVWKEYQKQGTAGGHILPDGLTRWQKLNSPIFTPSTKEESGHDVNITAASYLEARGEEGRQNVEKLSGAYSRAYAYAERRGILILDTKFEIATPFTLADEVLTPDSSRFTVATDLVAATADGRDPIFYDKERVREWGRTVQTPFGTVGINNLDPENPDHLKFVHSIEVPSEVVAETAERYQQIFEMLVGMPLSEYQRTGMGIEA